VRFYIGKPIPDTDDVETQFNEEEGSTSKQYHNNNQRFIQDEKAPYLRPRKICLFTRGLSLRGKKEAKEFEKSWSSSGRPRRNAQCRYIEA